MANKDFTTIKSNIGTDVQDTSSAFDTILGRYVNERYFRILRSINWEVINSVYSFPTVAGTQIYTLPEDFGKELYALDTTNGTELASDSFGNLVRAYPDDLTSSGTVKQFVIYGDAVKVQPTSAGTVTVVSSDASDTTQKVLIRGEVSNYETTEQLTLNGTTNVTGTLSFSRIKGISKDGNTTGKITVTCNSQTMAILPPKVNESRYKLIFLHYNPSTVITIKMPYIIKPLPLVENNDYPVVDIADLIEIGARADAWRYKRQFAKATDLEVLFERELQRFIWDKENKPNEIYQFMPQTFNKNGLY